MDNIYTKITIVDNSYVSFVGFTHGIIHHMGIKLKMVNTQMLKFLFLISRYLEEKSPSFQAKTIESRQGYKVLVYL